MAVAINPPESGAILGGVSWKSYESLLFDHLDSAGPRFAYDDGELEIKILSVRHEHPNRTLALTAEVIAEELKIDVKCLGSMTCKREDLLKGFEPDSCFYIQNLDKVFGKKEFDFTIDPPPDLVIEIDITSPSLPKFPIFAAFGVPEVWRYDGERVEIFRLNDGDYEAVERSIALPILTGDALTRFLHDSAEMKSTAWLRALRAWARECRSSSKDLS